MFVVVVVTVKVL